MQNRGHLVLWNAQLLRTRLHSTRFPTNTLRNFQVDFYLCPMDGVLVVGAWSHLSMKEGSLFYFVLFCSYEIHRTRMLLLVSLESSQQVGMSRGAWAWFCGVWTWVAKVLKYWIIFSLKIKLNHSWKFQRNWNVPLVKGCWKDLDEQDLMEFIW